MRKGLQTFEPIELEKVKKHLIKQEKFTMILQRKRYMTLLRKLTK